MADHDLTMTATEYHGWHFLPSDGCLANTDPKIKVQVGEIYHEDRRPIVPCDVGLHASARAIDALVYAPGSIVCQVVLSGVVILHGLDKAAASARRVVAMADATILLHEFACQCAEDVIHLCENKEVARLAIDTKRRWMRGEATDKELDAARDAARAAAWAAWDAAWDAAKAKLAPTVVSLQASAFELLDAMLALHD